MPSSSFPIQGVTPAGGGVEMRQEIDSWFHNPNNARQVAPFVLALKESKEPDPPGKGRQGPKVIVLPDCWSIIRARPIRSIYPAKHYQAFTENLSGHGTVLPPSGWGRSPNGRLLCPQRLDILYLASAIPAFI